MSKIVGVDTGGTFTDTVIVNEKGDVAIAKQPSTPGEFAQGVLNSLADGALTLGVTTSDLLSETADFLHGTTITANAVITRGGVKVGLITTRGHRDVMFFMRVAGRTAGLPYEELLNYPTTGKPEPIVPKPLVEEVDERVDYKGEVIVPLNGRGTREAIQRLLDKGVEAIAVSLLWSFLNPKHEQEIKQMIQETAPHVAVSISSELVPKMGEYERTAATVMNCYTLPLLSRYVRSLDGELQRQGLETPLLIMQSSGTVMTAEEAEAAAAHTLFSGPAGGVMGSRYIGALLNHRNIICTDVGGTSFDVGLVVNGEPVFRPVSIINQYHIALPMIDIVSIGSGGGSIAKVQHGRTLRVGPESAGAYPGPACYCLGGDEPTVADADVVLGHIDPDYFLGGKIKLDKAMAGAVIKRRVADPLGMTVVEAAAAIVDIVNNQMADLVRRCTVLKGYDPRDFVLYLYGGAGPTHGTAYGKDLEVQSIVVPLGNLAAVFSAFGIATADMGHVNELSEPARAPFSTERLNHNFDRLEQKAAAQLRREGIDDDQMVLTRSIDLRHRGQVHEVPVPVPSRTLTGGDAEKLIDDFERIYERLYGEGSSFREAGVELVTYRVTARGRLPKPVLARSTKVRSDVEVARKGERPAYWGEYKQFSPTPIYDGGKLLTGHTVAGPAIIEMAASTMPVHPGQRVTVDEYGNLVVTIGGA
ncbi:MAG: hydantoinase/oxoprolinase family protein [Chloroflexi bacterium]|nr:hydantoinase/oxoprolinase family protein [Chloroflexota bacterium]